MSLEGLKAVSSIAGTASSIAGMVGQGTKAAGEYQAASYNAALAEQEAELARTSAAIDAKRIEETATVEAARARQAAGIEVSRILRTGRRTQGTQAVMAAKSGMDVSQGSPLLAMLNTVRRTQEDAILTRYQADQDATMIEWQAAQDAALARWKGEVRAAGYKATAGEMRRQRAQGLLTGITRTAGAGFEALGKLGKSPGPSMKVVDLFGGASYT